MIRTYQQSLKFILEQRIVTPAQQKWIMKLLGYSFLVEYKKGKENKVADAFSRRLTNSVDGVREEVPEVKGVLYSISFPYSSWLQVLKDSYKEDDEYLKLLTIFSTNGLAPAGFSLQNGLFLYKDKVFFSTTSPLKGLVLQHVHGSPLGAFWLFEDLVEG